MKFLSIETQPYAVLTLKIRSSYLVLILWPFFFKKRQLTEKAENLVSNKRG